MRFKFCLAALLLLVTSAALPQAPSIAFGPRQDIPTGFQHLTGLAVADFNGDGKPDIAVTDDYTQTLIVFLNDGNGTFSKSVTTTLHLPSVIGTGFLIAGDVNEDGKQDLIVGFIAGQQTDLVLLGNGDGTFTQGEQIPGSYGHLSGALVDINGDKHLDFLEGDNGNIFAHLGDGKGNFNSQPIAQNNGLHLALVAGDFQGNKHTDFITSQYFENQLSYFSGLGDGTFLPATTITLPQMYNPASLAAADFNGDGKLDLIVGSADIATLYLGNGDGTFQTNSPIDLYIGQLTVPPTTQIEPFVAAADMDGNGTPDFVGADDGSNKLSVLLNDGTGKFPQRVPDFTAALDPGVGGLRLTDLNGDGLPDVILTNYKTQKISIFLSIPTRLSPTIALQSSAPQALVGNSVTISVQIQGTATAPPSGMVTLASGTTSFGQQPLDGAGHTTFTLQGLAAGQYPLVATYSGDPHYAAAANQTPLLESFTDFQASLSSPAQSVPAGASATYTLNLAPIAGFTGGISITCAGLPIGYTCAQSSASVSSQAITTQVVVSPPATTALFKPAPANSSFSRPVGLCLAACCGFAFCRRRRLPRLLSLALLATAVSLGCGSNASKPLASPPFTGTSNFTITATATQGTQTVSHQVAATLTVS